jgi:iron complex outermembrane receptor protein
MKVYRPFLVFLLGLLVVATTAEAQTTISGKVVDESGDPMPGANVVVKGTNTGISTDANGIFVLSSQLAPPLSILFSFVGYETLEILVTEKSTPNLQVVLKANSLITREIVVVGPGDKLPTLEVPFTVYHIGTHALHANPDPDVYGSLKRIRDVQVNDGSINFQAVNTRGFATLANVRFVQLVDGMDTAPPILNFPMGNLVGISELDVESIDLIPGASSALFGPNAFNGIINMTSKSPFEYTGFAAQMKGGVTKSDAQGNSLHPLYNLGLRYAHAFNKKFAFKINFSIIDATDWMGNDYITHRHDPSNPVEQTGRSDFDGLNLYGDDIVLVNVPGIGPLTRTGYREQDLIDYNARSIKGDIALHYRIKGDLELLYNYRHGSGNTVYQGTEKYAIRDFSLQYHKLELRNRNFFVRAYTTFTDAGKSYNVGALGYYVNEAYSPSPQWVPDYINAFSGYLTDTSYNDPDYKPGDHAAARRFADRNRLMPGTTAYNNTVSTLRNQYFQKDPPGARFSDDSRLYHGEFNYNFSEAISFMELQVGGNFRRYDLFSNGTVYNESPVSGAEFKRITIDEHGLYTQIAKSISKVRLTASLRYDKNQNFDALFTPRVSAVVELNKENFIRASFQTGFRNPDTQAQFIYFPSGSGILLGSTEANAARYGIHNGGAYTKSSYEAFRASGGVLDDGGNPVGGNASLLQTAIIPYVMPERIRTVEIGYRGDITKTLFVDANVFYNNYTNFIGDQLVYNKLPTSHQGNEIRPGTLWSPHVNSPEKVTSRGAGLGLSYQVYKTFRIDAGYAYQDYEADETEFIAGFNTPNHKLNVGFSNRLLTPKIGFSVLFRWQDEFTWSSGFGTSTVGEYGVLDAQVSYKINSMKTLLKIGGTNLIGGDYRPNFGSSFVGQQFYVSLTYDVNLFKN